MKARKLMDRVVELAGLDALDEAGAAALGGLPSSQKRDPEQNRH
jgi:hypothetical protein